MLSNPPLVKKLEDGHPEARGMLGRCCWGSGLKTKSEIREHFDFAVKNSPDDDVKARYSCHIASTYLEELNEQKYVEHLKKAASWGHPVAAYLVGAFYLRGIYSQRKDPHLAQKYLERARDLGHKTAKEVLARADLELTCEKEALPEIHLKKESRSNCLD